MAVGVWGEPDAAAATLTGAAVRSLTQPQLFVAGPRGWQPLLARDWRSAADRASAQLRLVSGVRWSDGSPIGAADLRRSADVRFVASVSDAGKGGWITVRFTHRLSLDAQRGLWSGLNIITPPRDGVFGGPFQVAGYTPGLELVLRRRSGWIGGRPWLDEVRLVVVPAGDVARRLLASGRLDVVMPAAATQRTAKLRAVDKVMVDVARPGGWSVALVANPARVEVGARLAALASVDRRRFVEVLLAGEASLLDGWGPVTPGPWQGRDGIGATAGLGGKTVTVTAANEEPMSGLVLRGMQRQGRAAGGTVELRNIEVARAEAAVAAGDFDVAEVMMWDPPQPCWTCRWGSVDSTLAAAADGGDLQAARALQVAVRDQGLAAPLWRPRTVLAWRTDRGVHGPEANGWALSGAWNAWSWWVER